MKICKRCRQEKSFIDFSKKKSNTDGLYNWCKACCSEHKRLNKDTVAQTKRNWAVKNREKLRAASAKWFKNNKIKKQQYAKHKYHTDIQTRLSCVLRSRLSHAVRKNIKNGSAVRDLGCSLGYLKEFIESKFQPGMSWENYGHDIWHIDHIRPLSSFDLSDPSEFKKACHYTNLQPLWAEENLAKGKRFSSDL